MQVISDASQKIPQGLYAKVAHYRQRVFVEQLGWAPHGQDSVEAGQFDRPDTVYVVGRDDANQVLGCARLLPSARLHLPGLLFPKLLNALPLPCSSDVCELSLLAVMGLNSERTRSRHFSSHMAIPLFQEKPSTALRYRAIYGEQIANLVTGPFDARQPINPAVCSRSLGC